MFKKIIKLGMMVVMFFSLVGLTACDSFDLATYKIEAKAELGNYVHEVYYSPENWQVVIDIIENGKNTIDGATNKTSVDIASAEAKKLILEIQMAIIEVETDDMIELHTWAFTSGIPNNVIKVKHSDENTIFECNVDKGQFWVYDLQEYSNKAILKPNDSVYWHSMRRESSETIQQAFIDIILRNSSNIVGYAVINVTQNPAPDRSNHNAELLISALFPKIDGEYQDITENQIELIIEKTKRESLLNIAI